eukprot:TRINITY_DN277_c0_g2_i5.p1 TRINITY_DN277_c0_g2~~TRINITY_DN277_c0_g2_i5.p1  ORF type:complete len:705 (+),score=211.83 TRINITY_DN277_c0_g2_i5:61-2175(+)
MDDLGMQRAIWASIQSSSSARPAAPAYRPSPSYTRDIAPTQPRSTMAPRPRPADSGAARARGGSFPAAARTPAIGDAGGREPSMGRRNLLAREGVHSQMSTRAASSGALRSPQKTIGTRAGSFPAAAEPAPRPRARAAPPATSYSADSGSAPQSQHTQPRAGRRLGPGDGVKYLGNGPMLSRKASVLPGWTSILAGGELQRLNPSGSDMQVVCEEGSEPADLHDLPASHCLLSVTGFPAMFAEADKQVTVSMTPKMQYHRSSTMMFGVVVNFQQMPDGTCHFVCAALSQSSDSRMQVQAQVMRCRVSADGSRQSSAVETITHSADVAVRVGQPLRIAVTRQNERLDVTINGAKVFKNVSAGLPASSQFGICAVGTKAQVRDVRVVEGGPADAADDSRSRIDPHFASIIEQDIIDSSPNVQWEDIAALDEAKRLLNEAVVLPLIIPEFFTGLRTPWKGVLLFGPPGTGKTLLAKAVATCANTTFFNITASTLLSKWHGESEKIVRTLFQLARKHAPSTIFFDEIDALMMRRGGQNEHESSRRLKSELLSQIDGMNSSVAGDTRLMVLATSNKPWDLDEAFRRRLEKRIYIPLPNAAARVELFKINLKGIECAGDVTFDDLAARTEKYSGADIHQVCRDASMAPMRRAITDKSPAEIARMKQDGLLSGASRVLLGDFVDAIRKIQPSVAPSELTRYQQWEKEFASV